jgi:hypothetical protein
MRHKMVRKIGDKEVMTTEEVASQTGVTKDTLRGMRERNKTNVLSEGPAYILIGRSIYYLRDSVESYLRDLGVKE